MLLLRLRVVLLFVDAAALAVLGLLDAALLARANLAVGAGARFLAVDARFAALEARGFAVGEAARLHALLDALLLIDVALDVGLHALRRGRVRVAGLRIVLLAVDVAAHAVLLARKARLLGGRELAVLHGARLVALDARFLALEARRLARIELAGLQALLDALLLVDVALHGAGLRESRAGKREAEGGGGRAMCEFHFLAPPSGWLSPLKRASRACVDGIPCQLVTTCIMRPAWRLRASSSSAAASAASGRRRRSSAPGSI